MVQAKVLVTEDTGEPSLKYNELPAASLHFLCSSLYFGMIILGRVGQFGCPKAIL